MIALYISSQSGVSLLLVGLIGGGVISDFLEIQMLINKVNVQGFKKYKEKTVTKLKKLGGNLEDLENE